MALVKIGQRGLFEIGIDFTGMEWKVNRGQGIGEYSPGVIIRLLAKNMERVLNAIFYKILGILIKKNATNYNSCNCLRSLYLIGGAKEDRIPDLMTASHKVTDLL